MKAICLIAFLILGSLIAIPHVSANSAVTYLSTSTYGHFDTNATHFSFNRTVESTANLAVVFLTLTDDNPDWANLTFGGVDISNIPDTQYLKPTTTGNSIAVFFVSNPPTGNVTINMDITTTVNFLMTVITYSNVNRVQTPLKHDDSATFQNSETITVTPSVTNALIQYEFLALYANQPLGALSGASLQVENSTNHGFNPVSAYYSSTGIAPHSATMAMSDANTARWAGFSIELSGVPYTTDTLFKVLFVSVIILGAGLFLYAEAERNEGSILSLFVDVAVVTVVIVLIVTVVEAS